MRDVVFQKVLLRVCGWFLSRSSRTPAFSDNGVKAEGHEDESALEAVYL